MANERSPAVEELIWYSIPGVITAVAIIAVWPHLVDCQAKAILGILFIPTLGFIVHQIFRLIFEKHMGGFAPESRRAVRFVRELAKIEDVQLSHQEAYVVWATAHYDARYPSAFRQHDARCWHYILSLQGAALAAALGGLIALGAWFVCCRFSLLGLGVVEFGLAYFFYLKARSTYEMVQDEEVAVVRNNECLFRQTIRNTKHIKIGSAVANHKEPVDRYLRRRSMKWFALLTGIGGLICMGILLCRGVTFNEDVLFWIYSTVAQTLGTMIALAAVFVVYRLQVQENRIEARVEQAYKKLRFLVAREGSDSSSWNDAQERRLSFLPREEVCRNASAVLGSLRRDPKSNETKIHNLEEQVAHIRRIEGETVSAQSAIHAPLWASIVTVALALVLLATAAKSGSHRYAVIPACVVLAGAVFSVTVTGITIARLVMPDKDEQDEPGP